MSQSELAAMKIITISQGIEIPSAKQSINTLFEKKAFRTKKGRRRENMHMITY